MNIDQFSEKFKLIKEEGWTPALRGGTTGVGYTFETLIGKKEDNQSLPDIEGYEIKTKLINNTEWVRLFTHDNKCWNHKKDYIVNTFGKPDKDGKMGIFGNVRIGTLDGYGLFTVITKDSVILMHINGSKLGEWNFENLIKKFEIKFPSLILVLADRKIEDDVIFYKYNTATVLDGGSKESFRNMFLNGKIYI